MPIITPANFREGEAADFCSGLVLSESEATDTILAATILRATSRVDEFCHDIFEGITETITLDGSGDARLPLPRRCTAISALATLDQFGNSSTVAAGAYRLHSSLVDTGSRRLSRDTTDWVELIYFGTGIANQLWGNPWKFYPGAQNVQITGTWGWTTPPADIQRAVAVIVFDQIKPIGSQTVKATRWQGGSELYDISTSQPTGIVEVDMILKEYNREQTPIVAIA